MLQKVPGGQKAQVFVGTFTLCAIAAYPVLKKQYGGGGPNKGHEYFSQEKPSAVQDLEDLKEKGLSADEIADRRLRGEL